MNITELYQCFLQCEGVISTDTRNITPNCLFFALKGENFDANEFAKQALEKGARFVVMDNAKLASDPNKMIVVPNVLGALQQLAKYHRQQLGLPVIALTGSNGKTTTKELLTTVLSTKYKVASTKGNLNNHIGVPLTLLSITESHDLAIVEMGANHKQEIAFLCEIADPDYGYITNFGKAHLEGFGSIEGVIKAKSELYDYLEDGKKTAFVNLDDPIQDAKSITFSRFTFSLEQTADIRFDNYYSNPNAGVTYQGQNIDSNLTGLYNATNIAACFAIGKYFGVQTNLIKTAIEQYVPNNNRNQWVQVKDMQILLDAYNANPSSMKAAIDNFIALDSKEPKTLILGDMFELGQHSSQEHLQIIENLENLPHIHAIFIGEQFFAFQNKQVNNLEFYKDFDQFKLELPKISQLLHNHLILIKGSRALALERVIELI